MCPSGVAVADWQRWPTLPLHRFLINGVMHRIVSMLIIRAAILNCKLGTCQFLRLSDLKFRFQRGVRFCPCSQPRTRKTCLPSYDDFILNPRHVLNHDFLSLSADGKWVHPEQHVRRRTRPAQHEWNSAPYCPDAQPRDFVQPPRPPSHRLLPLTS